MNDFTKEELLNLRGSLMVCFADDGSDDKLMGKLNSMIDTYCEHEPEPITQEICCIKCQKTLV